MVWTEEMMNTLKTLWSEGKSASEIAEILGLDISRNAVIGKAHRLGVSGRPSPIKKKTGQPLTLLSMTERMCKWPFGDPKKADFHFCGRPVAATITYCPEHRSASHQSTNLPEVLDQVVGSSMLVPWQDVNCDSGFDKSAGGLVDPSTVKPAYASLMNPGVSVPFEITQLTGITTKMVRSAPPAATVMRDVTRFVGDTDLIAHNASFDRRFLEAEHRRIGVSRRLDFVCTMLLSRRIFDGAPNHKLGTLVGHLGLPADGALHRALADATVTAELLFRIQADISARYGLSLSHKALARVQRAPRKNLEKVMAALEKAGQQSAATSRQT